MDLFEKVEQKTYYFAKSTFINLSFLITLFKAHERGCLLTVFQDCNSQCHSELRIEMSV